MSHLKYSDRWTRANRRAVEEAAATERPDSSLRSATPRTMSAMSLPAPGPMPKPCPLNPLATGTPSCPSTCEMTGKHVGRRLDHSAPGLHERRGSNLRKPTLRAPRGSGRGPAAQAPGAASVGVRRARPHRDAQSMGVRSAAEELAPQRERGSTRDPAARPARTCARTASVSGVSEWRNEPPCATV